MAETFAFNADIQQLMSLILSYLGVLAGITTDLEVMTRLKVGQIPLEHWEAYPQEWPKFPPMRI